MDFVIIGNQWDVHKDNPTSKHHVAMELVRKGHRVLWVNGTGMRTPNIGSGADRGRIWKKISDACKGVYRQEAGGKPPSPEAMAYHGRQENVKNTQRPTPNDQCLPSHLHGPNTSDGRAQQQSTNNNQLTASGLWVTAPLVLPIPGNTMVRKLNEGVYLWAINRAVRQLGFDEPVLINFLPVIPSVLKKWKFKSVYYCVDRWSAFSRYDSGLMDKLDIECCENADYVFASARDLEERCKRYNANTHLVLHGVDYENFAGSVSHRGTGRDCERPGERTETDRPGDLPEGRIVGTFGVIDERIDQELVIKLARELNRKDEGGDLRPENKNSTTNNPPGTTMSQTLRAGASTQMNTDRDASLTTINKEQTTGVGQQLSIYQAAGMTNIVLIGKSDVDVSRLEAEPNIHLLGPKNFDELPAYISHFDVGIIAYVLNDQTRAINPIKLREMLAGGRRVVSTNLPEVESLKQQVRAKSEEQRGEREGESLTQRHREHGEDIGVFVAGGHDEFVEMVKKVLDNPLSVEEKMEISRSMASETWSAKVDEILEIIGTADTRR